MENIFEHLGYENTRAESITGYAALNFIDDRPIADWDLEIYDPNGNLVVSSTTENGNVEIVAFDPLVTGNYTIKITKHANVNEKEFVYLAWW